MKLNVRENTKRNLLVGAINKMIVLILPFLVRSLINTRLSSGYLGLNSLFSSVLTVLNLSEMGISSAIVFHMYKPVADNDTEKVCALLNLYRRAYACIGLVVLLLGLVAIPLLPFVINGTCPDGVNLILVYLIFLSDSVISYFMFGYLSSLLVVYQKHDIASTINTVTSVGLNLLKIAVLYVTSNYYLVILLQPAFTILYNVWIAIIVKKLYPQYRCRGVVDSATVASIKRLVAGSCVQKICGVTRNALDSICTSAFLGLSLTAMYNNYYTIMASITSFLGLFYSALIGGVGNHIALKSKEENYGEMKKIDFIYLWISGWCATSLLCLFQPFMRLWMGKGMLLDFKTVVLFCIYFYLLKLGDIRYIYTEASGIMWKHKMRAILESASNLLLNIVLGKLFGVNGIIVATIISLFFLNYIWANHITFKAYFGSERVRDYYLYQAKYTLVNLLSCLVTWSVVSHLHFDSQLFTLFVRGCVCLFLPNFVCWAVYRKKEEFRFAVSLIKGKCPKIT